MSGYHIKSKSVESKGYLPSQLRGMLTLVSEYENSDNVLCLPLKFIGHVHPVRSHGASVAVYYMGNQFAPCVGNELKGIKIT